MCSQHSVSAGATNQTQGEHTKEEFPPLTAGFMWPPEQLSSFPIPPSHPPPPIFFSGSYIFPFWLLWLFCCCFWIFLSGFPLGKWGLERVSSTLQMLVAKAFKMMPLACSPCFPGLGFVCTQLPSPWQKRAWPSVAGKPAELWNSKYQGGFSQAELSLIWRRGNHLCTGQSNCLWGSQPCFAQRAVWCPSKLPACFLVPSHSSKHPFSALHISMVPMGWKESPFVQSYLFVCSYTGLEVTAGG